MVYCICQVNLLLGIFTRTLEFDYDMLQVMSCVVVSQRTFIGLKLVKATGTLKSSQCEDLHLYYLPNFLHVVKI